jgi:hypothetical protein
LEDRGASVKFSAAKSRRFRETHGQNRSFAPIFTFP